MRIALAAIWANKLRSGLATLGIVIGIVTVTLMGTAIQGLNRSFLEAVSTIGADVLYVQRFSWFINSWEEWLKAEKRQRITLAQVRAVEKQMRQARAIAPFVETRRPVNYKNRRSDSVTVIGTTDQFQFTKGISVALGRYMTAPEADGGRPVCVLGSTVATNLFLIESPVGNKIRLGSQTFEVIGVLEKQGDFFGEFSSDNAVIIPLQQFITSFWHSPDFQIQVKVIDIARLDEAKEELRGILRRIRRLAPGTEDDFSIDQQEMFLSMFGRVSRTIASVGLFITGLSLFVGGIGIMNIMFVSVAERTREIGIRKAIGAKRRAILTQFLIESASICVLGGLLALAIAYPVTLLLKKQLGGAMSPTVVTIALLVSAFTGILSGFFPAWRAARLNPVDALRNE
ncbi:MAG: ABC transporter permease [Verrucomicrobia bacterium]|nr:ABC transporter permease [Verrucomicrobiota bacterium]